MHTVCNQAYKTGRQAPGLHSAGTWRRINKETHMRPFQSANGYEKCD